MGWVLTLVFVMLAPAAMIALLGKLIEFVGKAAPLASYGRLTTYRACDDLPRLLATLHRLDGQYVSALAGSEFAQAHRVRSLRLAYDQTLTAVCRCAGMDQIPTVPLTGANRVRLEAALSDRGLQW